MLLGHLWARSTLKQKGLKYVMQCSSVRQPAVDVSKILVFTAIAHGRFPVLYCYSHQGMPSVNDKMFTTQLFPIETPLANSS